MQGQADEMGRRHRKGRPDGTRLEASDKAKAGRDRSEPPAGISVGQGQPSRVEASERKMPARIEGEGSGHDNRRWNFAQLTVADARIGSRTGREHDRLPAR